MTPPPFDLAQVLGESIALREQAEGYARAYLEGVHHRPVAPDSEALASLEGLQPSRRRCGSARGAQAASSPRLLPRRRRGAGVSLHRTAAPTITLAARLLADSWDQNEAVAAVAPPIAALETVVEGWLHSSSGCRTP